MSTFAERLKSKFQKRQKASDEKKLHSTQEQLLQDLFLDMYRDRHKLYRLSFIKGIFTGFGTVIGGTLIVALLIWLLSLFINAPVVGNYVRDIQHSIDRTK